MKKILLASLAVVCLFSFGIASAQDNVADTFKNHCQACHGADGSRAPNVGGEPIKGRSADEILKELQGYKAGTFGGKQKMIMQGVLKQISDDQMKGLAEYISKM